MAGIGNIMSQMILYCFGPFFCYPWKPIINLKFGTTYSIGFKHFWEQHRDVYNLAWHFVCLFYQLFCNFAFLAAIDEYIIQTYNLSTELRWFSIISAGLWILTLLFTRKCPIVIRIVSSVCILNALIFAKSITAQNIELTSYCAFSIIWIFSILRNGLFLRKDSLKLLFILGGKTLLYYYLFKHHNGCLSEYKTMCNVIFFSIIILCSLIRDTLLAIKSKYHLNYIHFKQLLFLEVYLDMFSSHLPANQ